MQSRHLERINELVREKRALLGVNNQLRERNAELEQANNAAWLRIYALERDAAGETFAASVRGLGR